MVGYLAILILKQHHYSNFSLEVSDIIPHILHYTSFKVKISYFIDF